MLESHLELQRRERCSDALWQDGQPKRLFSHANGFGSVLFNLQQWGEKNYNKAQKLLECPVKL